MLETGRKPGFVEEEDPDQGEQVGADERGGGGDDEGYQARVKSDQNDNRKQVQDTSDCDEEIGGAQLLVAAKDLRGEAGRQADEEDSEGRGYCFAHGGNFGGRGEVEETIPVEPWPDQPCGASEQQGDRKHYPESGRSVGTSVVAVVSGIGLGDEVGEGVCDAEIKHQEHRERSRNGHPDAEVFGAEISDHNGNRDRADRDHDSFAQHAGRGALHKALRAVADNRC